MNKESRLEKLHNILLKGNWEDNEIHTTEYNQILLFDLYEELNMRLEKHDLYLHFIIPDDADAGFELSKTTDDHNRIIINFKSKYDGFLSARLNIPYLYSSNWVITKRFGERSFKAKLNMKNLKSIALKLYRCLIDAWEIECKCVCKQRSDKVHLERIINFVKKKTGLDYREISFNNKKSVRFACGPLLINCILHEAINKFSFNVSFIKILEDVSIDNVDELIKAIYKTEIGRAWVTNEVAEALLGE